VIGSDCVIGSYVDIEGEVRIGDFVSLQSGCYLTRGVMIEDEVFCGPRVVTMNDKYISYRRPSLVFARAAPRRSPGKCRQTRSFSRHAPGTE
jgi:UDP-3-O-[3-hydroxymyristoyl] glucosamine N-acyltransferase